jgi:hypothetical protein
MDLYGGAGPPVKWLLVYKTHEYYNKMLQVPQTRVNGALGCKCVHAYITLHCISLHCIVHHTCISNLHPKKTKNYSNIGKKNMITI